MSDLAPEFEMFRSHMDHRVYASPMARVATKLAPRAHLLFPLPCVWRDVHAELLHREEKSFRDIACSGPLCYSLSPSFTQCTFFCAPTTGHAQGPK